jgi:hypothetical protein
VDPLTVLLTALLATQPVVVHDGDANPHGCHPEQAVHALRHHLGPAVRFDEVIVGYANGLGQLEFSATVAGVEAHGKGAMQCDTQAIVAFGLGPAGGLRVARLCPPARAHAMVACARDWD